MKPEVSPSLMMQVKRKETTSDSNRHSRRRMRSEVLQKPKHQKVPEGRG